MRSRSLVGLVMSCAVGVVSCADQPPEKGPMNRVEGAACPEPRPSACTMEYDPVCGQGADGQRTYSNGCQACANPDVLGFEPGPC